MNLNGFIKLHRKIMAWEWYNDNVVKAVFLHLLLTAQYEPCTRRDCIILPGQLLVGRRKLAAELGLSEQQVRTALKKLKETGEIGCVATNKYTLITIANWNEYQFNAYGFNPNDSPFSPQKEPADNREATTYKEIQEGNKTKNEEGFNTVLGACAHESIEDVANEVHEMAERVRRKCAEWGYDCEQGG